MHAADGVRPIPGFILFDKILTKDFDAAGFVFTLDFELFQVSIEGGIGDFVAHGLQAHVETLLNTVVNVFDERFDGLMGWFKLGASLAGGGLRLRAVSRVARPRPGVSVCRRRSAAG